MDDVLFYRVVLSFLVGGGVITLFTLAAERFGSTIGGIISGFPTTMVVGYVFAALVVGAENMRMVASSGLVSLSFLGLFVACFEASGCLALFSEYDSTKPLVGLCCKFYYGRSRYFFGDFL